MAENPPKLNEQASSTPLPPSPTPSPISLPNPLTQPSAPHLRQQVADSANQSNNDYFSRRAIPNGDANHAGPAGRPLSSLDLLMQHSATQGRYGSASSETRGRTYGRAPLGHVQMTFPRFTYDELIEVVYPTLDSDTYPTAAASEASDGSSTIAGGADDSDNNNNNKNNGSRNGNRGRNRNRGNRTRRPRPRPRESRLCLLFPMPAWLGRILGADGRPLEGHLESALMGVELLGFLIVIISSVAAVSAIAFFIVVLLNNFFHFLPNEFEEVFRQGAEKRWAVGQ